MKKLLIITLLLFVSLAVLHSNEGGIRLAVARFDDSLTLASENIRAGAAVTSILEQKYSGIDRFCVRDRNAISDYLDSIVRVQLGLAQPDMLKTSSHDLKIDYLTVGTVSRFGDRYEIDVRTININTWKIIHSRGCSMYSISNGIDDVVWYIDRQFTPEYVRQRDESTVSRPVVTVHKFRDDNQQAAKTGYGGAFAEILNSNLGSFYLITTVERTYTKALVNEKMLEMAGVIENDGSDSSFSLQGIQYKLTGEINVFDDMICVNYRVHDTVEGRVIHMGTREIASAVGLRPAALDIALTVEDLLNNRIGTLKLESVPEGAEVFINDEPSGSAPLVIALPRGFHSVMVRQSGYETHREQVEIKPREIEVRRIELAPLSMKLIEEAYLYEKAGKWEEAVDTYSKFIDAYGDTSDADSAYYRKGHIEMINLKRYRDALATFTALVNRYPDTMTRAEAYYGLARTHFLMGNSKEARAVLDYLLEKYSDTYAAEEAKKIRQRL